MIYVYIRLKTLSHDVLTTLSTLFSRKDEYSWRRPLGADPVLWADTAVKQLEEFLIVNGHAGDYDIWLTDFGKECSLKWGINGSLYLKMPVGEENDISYQD